MKIVTLFPFLFCMPSSPVNAFLLVSGVRRRSTIICDPSSSTRSFMVASADHSQDKRYSKQNDLNNGKESHHFLLKPFVTSSGELINPYDVLQVPRDADRSTIKTSYKQLAKKYHPDGARNRSILPGKCNNEDEVREEWERIQVAYNILIDNKTRKRYDRSAMIADPGAAFRQAAVEATVTGVSNIGRGLFTLGQIAIDSLSKRDGRNG